MALPDIAVVKTWCRIDDAEFDTILPMLIADATAQAGHQIAQDSAYYIANEMPASVLMWCCAQIAHWIATPAATTTGNAPQRNLFLDGLLDPYRQYKMEVKPV